jgi:hypothetical protein
MNAVMCSECDKIRLAREESDTPWRIALWVCSSHCVARGDAAFRKVSRYLLFSSVFKSGQMLRRSAYHVRLLEPSSWRIYEYAHLPA